MAFRLLLTKNSLSSLRLVHRVENLGFMVTQQQQVHGLKTAALPDLPYDYGALEPVISGEIMKIHHQKHHQTYVTNYNKALEQLDDAIDKGNSYDVVKLQSAIKFNGGGHINHSIFWNNLAPVNEGGGMPPKGDLGWAIDTHFGSLENFIKKMNAEGAALQGSGWVWLGLETELKKLVIETTANQDPLVTKGPALVPILGIDVWEHAYYLQYKNVRPDYLTNIWNVMNWKYAEEEGGGMPPKGDLGWAIDTHFGSLENFIKKMNAEGAALQGSGWVWLGLETELKKLVIETTANQDPLVTKGPALVPILGIDVWEHAYYLQYKNVRPDYLTNIWNVMNWKYAEEVYDKASC